MEIIFRNETEAPTEPGWYYTKKRGSAEAIRPTRVIDYFGEELLVDNIDSYLEIGDFAFFGPVPTCKEG